jgi:hypothetical protein
MVTPVSKNTVARPLVRIALEGVVDAQSVRDALATPVSASKAQRGVVLVVDTARLDGVRPGASAALQDVLAQSSGRWAGVLFVGESRTWVQVANGLSNRIGVPVRHARSAAEEPGSLDGFDPPLKENGGWLDRLLGRKG